MERMENNRTKVNVIPEVQQASLLCERSPANKKSVKCLNVSDTLEAVLQDVKGAVDMLFSEYADVMSERATADTSQVMEMEDVLNEARGLESHLREKKERLRQSLAAISDKLQG